MLFYKHARYTQIADLFDGHFDNGFGQWCFASFEQLVINQVSGLGLFFQAQALVDSPEHFGGFLVQSLGHNMSSKDAVVFEIVGVVVDGAVVDGVGTGAVVHQFA